MTTVGNHESTPGNLTNASGTFPQAGGEVTRVGLCSVTNAATPSRHLCSVSLRFLHATAPRCLVTVTQDSTFHTCMAP